MPGSARFDVLNFRPEARPEPETEAEPWIHDNKRLEARPEARPGPTPFFKIRPEPDPARAARRARAGLGHSIQDDEAEIDTL